MTRIENDFHCVSGVPAFLYPSQGTDKFDDARVKHYQDLASDRQRFPRAIAYHAQGFCSVLLDGHHKAAACALNGDTVPTLLIIPCSGMGYKPGVMKKMVEDTVNFFEIVVPLSIFSAKQMDAVRKMVNQWRQREDVRLRQHNLVNRVWEDSFTQTAYTYPNVKEHSEEIALEICPFHDSYTASWLENAVGINAWKLKAAICYYMRKDKKRARDLALLCARLNSAPELTLTAFQALAVLKDDSEIEQFFIDWLINDNDPHSALRKIADNYWDRR